MSFRYKAGTQDVVFFNLKTGLKCLSILPGYQALEHPMGIFTIPIPISAGDSHNLPLGVYERIHGDATHRLLHLTAPQMALGPLAEALQPRGIGRRRAEVGGTLQVDDPELGDLVAPLCIQGGEGHHLPLVDGDCAQHDGRDQQADRDQQDAHARPPTLAQ